MHFMPEYVKIQRCVLQMVSKSSPLPVTVVRSFTAIFLNGKRIDTYYHSCKPKILLCTFNTRFIHYGVEQTPKMGRKYTNFKYLFITQYILTLSSGSLLRGFHPLQPAVDLRNRKFRQQLNHILTICICRQSVEYTLL